MIKVHRNYNVFLTFRSNKSRLKGQDHHAGTENCMKIRMEMVQLILSNKFLDENFKALMLSGTKIFEVFVL